MTMETPDGYLLVTRRMDMAVLVPPYQYFYDYALCMSEEYALELKREYENGEYSGWEFRAILPCIKGVPIGSQSCAR